jgi:hypothetical protein
MTMLASRMPLGAATAPVHELFISGRRAEKGSVWLLLGNLS